MAAWIIRHAHWYVVHVHPKSSTNLVISSFPHWLYSNQDLLTIMLPKLVYFMIRLESYIKVDCWDSWETVIEKESYYVIFVSLFFSVCFFFLSCFCFVFSIFCFVLSSKEKKEGVCWGDCWVFVWMFNGKKKKKQTRHILNHFS